MRRFSIIEVNCEGCRKPQNPDGWSGHCPGCGRGSFHVEIERAASGWESLALEDFMPKPGYAALLDDDASQRYWRTQSFLECAGVSGEEVDNFRSAPVELRRKMYVGWKRRELEARLTPDQRVCGRCGVIFRAFGNAWNRSGYCSRACKSAASKSKNPGRWYPIAEAASHDLRPDRVIHP
jgi:hypothetical protein